MQARGPLMIEHRLIERMIAQIKQALEAIEVNESADPSFVDMVIDFIRVYADRTHHGKEEDILFRDLKQRSLSEQDRRMMNELIQEHVFGRKTTKELEAANQRYRDGESAALDDLASAFRSLIDFYPKHIEKEDKIFFPAARAYFTEEEDQAMLEEFWDFDRKMIHEKYQAVVDTIEQAS